jgi:hypothetical protein
MITMKRNLRMVCLSIASVLELYTAYRIPQNLYEGQTLENLCEFDDLAYQRLI